MSLVLGILITVTSYEEMSKAVLVRSAVKPAVAETELHAIPAS